jgi:hypothetical protein
MVELYLHLFLVDCSMNLIYLIMPMTLTSELGYLVWIVLILQNLLMLIGNSMLVLWIIDEFLSNVICIYF